LRAEASPEERRRFRHALGWTYWPFFAWRPLPQVGPGGPGAILSIVHSGYFFSACALALGLALWLAGQLPGARLFLLLHLIWISAMISLILLNSGFLEHLDGRPLERLGWANLLTMARLCFLPVLLYLLWLREWRAGLALYVVLGLTDVADGAVARRRGEESKLGFVLDPFVDILFHLGVLLGLSLLGILSWLTGGLVLARYLLLLAGCGLLYLTKGEIWIQPTPFGKATGLAIAALTGAALFLLGIGGAAVRGLPWAGHGLSVLFAAGVVHVCVIGHVNFRRPAVGGIAVYRRGWGLLVGRAAGGRARRSRRDGPDPG
jgi:cardiolipin synthase